jgi:hypothetical protein
VKRVPRSRSTADALILVSTLLVGCACFLPWYSYRVGTSSLSQQTALCGSGPAPLCPGLAFPSATTLNVFGNDTFTWRLSILAVSLIIVGLVIVRAVAPTMLSPLRTWWPSLVGVAINAVLVGIAFIAFPMNPLAGLPRSASWSYGAYAALAAAVVAGTAAFYGLSNPHRRRPLASFAAASVTTPRLS